MSAQRQLDLLGTGPQKKRRIMARMIDAGHFPDGRMAVEWACRKCAWVQWLAVARKCDAKRGYPCPTCNTPAAAPRAHVAEGVGASAAPAGARPAREAQE